MIERLRRLFRSSRGQASWTILGFVGMFTMLVGSTALVAWSEVRAANNLVGTMAQAALHEAMDQQVQCDQVTGAVTLNPDALEQDFLAAYDQLATQGTLPQPNADSCVYGGAGTPAGTTTLTLSNMPAPSGSSVMTRPISGTMVVYQAGATDPVTGGVADGPGAWVQVQVPVDVFTFAAGGFTYSASLVSQVQETPTGQVLYTNGGNQTAQVSQLSQYAALGASGYGGGAAGGGSGASPAGGGSLAGSGGGPTGGGGTSGGPSTAGASAPAGQVCTVQSVPQTVTTTVNQQVCSVQQVPVQQTGYRQVCTTQTVPVQVTQYRTVSVPETGYHDVCTTQTVPVTSYRTVYVTQTQYRYVCRYEPQLRHTICGYYPYTVRVPETVPYTTYKTVQSCSMQPYTYYVTTQQPYTTTVYQSQQVCTQQPYTYTTYQSQNVCQTQQVPVQQTVYVQQTVCQ
ncbi:MAG: hypothetical protein K6V73_06300 [Firmicutes bacterium]|nr:hypothetical protein [Bacillota bacterium]